MSMTRLRRWLVATLALFAMVTAMAPLAAAGPEGSDEFYLDNLNGLPVYKEHSKQFLLQEGHKVCSIIQEQGASEDSATDMVQSDLGTSTVNAYRLVVAAELGLGCFSLKVHGM